jgi:CubicO group peptidase (beta-lactamase class C family)
MITKIRISLTAQLDRYVQTYVNLELFSGSVLVANKGKILLSKGYGMANYEHVVPNMPQTKFHIGSITKQFTAMAIMQLVAQGKLKLEDTIATIFPDYPDGKDITIYQLLTHTSGIVEYLIMSSEIDFRKPITIAELVAHFKDKPLEFAPGSKYKYSNSGYVLLAAIIEKISGQSYETFLQERIFKPLGMHDTGLLQSTPLLAHRAQGYNRGADLENSIYYDPSVITGPGALYSTVENLYKWDRALYTESLLSRSLLLRLWEPCLNNYCLGWARGILHDRSYVWHNGGWFDCHAMLMRFIDDDIFVVVLGNFGLLPNHYTPTEVIAKNLASMVLGQKPEYTPKKHVKITINPAIYDQYVGTYKPVGTNFNFIVTKEHDKLFVAIGKRKDEIYPEAESQFFLNILSMDVQFSFIKDATGKVIKLIMYQGGSETIVEKVA